MSAETSSKMTLGQKVRLGAYAFVALFAIVELAINWDPVVLHYLPGDHTFHVPAALLCILMFGLGSAATFIYVSVHTLKKNKEAGKPPASLPPASPPSTSATP